MLYIDGKPTKLKPGDIAIFRVNDKTLQYVRRSTNLTNLHGDDKTQFSNSIALSEDLCVEMVAGIAGSHGFGYVNVSGIYKREGLLYFRFIKLKK